MSPTVSLTLGAAFAAACREIDRLDARWLLQHIAHIDHAELLAHPEKPIRSDQLDAYRRLVARRAQGEPLAYLTGSSEFYGLKLHVDNHVLIPRPESERLVELALGKIKNRDRPRILDLGTGSGAIAIAIAVQYRQMATIVASDISPQALAVAQRNAQQHRAAIRFVVSDWFSALDPDEKFDLIVSNPPYIAAGDPHLLQHGLPFEPALALCDGVTGGDGLACIQHIIHLAPGHLKQDGVLLLEHGYDQADRVRALLTQSGFDAVTSWRDFSAIERVSGGELR